MVLELTQEERQLVNYYRNASSEHKDMAFNIVRMSSNLTGRQDAESEKSCEVILLPQSR